MEEQIEKIEEGEGEVELPCICPIVNSLSNLSVPASNNNFPPLASKNFLLNPTNQPSQNGCVAARSVLHPQVLLLLSPSSNFNKAGTLVLALIEFRIVRDRMCHSIPEDKEAKPRGRVERYVCIVCNASIADPSTTSRTA